MSEFLNCSEGHQWERSAEDPGAAGSKPAACPIWGNAGEVPSSSDFPSGLAGTDDEALGRELPPPPRPSPAAVARIAALMTVPPQRSPAVEWPTVTGYDIVGELGRGAMGVVYRAVQVKLKRVVALKVIRAGASAGLRELARFRVEAEAVARLQHPNIVQIYEVGEQDGWAYFSLELVDGGSLAEKAAGTPQPARPAAQLVETLARAIHFTHERGVIHRDLKPANILLTPDGVAKITDFGLAKRVEAEDGQTRSGDIVGTPSYMAPEQAQGRTRDIGPAADVYALGAILYELLTGRPPFKAETPLDTMLQVRSEEPVPPRRLQPKMPRDLETVCLKCLHKEQGKRYANAAALAEDLRRFQTGEPIHARPASVWVRALKGARRRLVLTVAMGLIGLAAFGSLVGIVWHNRQLNAAWEGAEDRRQEAERERARAEANRQQAEANAQKARDQRRLALETLMTVVFDLQKELADKPGMLELREKQLQKAIDGLQRVIQSDEKAEAEAVPSMVAALADMGDTLLQLGRTEAAFRYFERSHRLAAVLAATHPTNPKAQRSLAVSYNGLGDASLRLGRTAQARDYYRKNLELIALLTTANPNDLHLQRDMAAAYQGLGNVSFVLREPAVARDSFLKALESAEARAAAEPRNARAQRAVAVLHGSLGHVNLLLGERAQSQEHYRKGLGISQRLAASDPNNIRAQRDLSLFYDRLGQMRLEAGESQAARDYFRKSLKVDETLAQANRNNAEIQRAVSFGYIKLGQVSFALGEAGTARDYYHKGLELAERLAAADPTSVQAQMNVSLACHQLGDLERAGFDHEKALGWYERALDVLQRLEGERKQKGQPPLYTQTMRQLEKEVAFCRAARPP
jgi:serine/threonine-protein kinase